MIGTIVVVTVLAIIMNPASKVFFHEFINISAASAYDFYPLCLKHSSGSLSHVSGKHYGDSHLSEYWGYAALAATAFG